MSEQTPFYQTTKMSLPDLLEAIDAAKIQNDRVMLIYKVKNRPMSASEVWQIYKTWFNNAPLTSIRRSITNLAHPHCYNGIPVTPIRLFDTGETKSGLYGRPERIWVL